MTYAAALDTMLSSSATSVQLILPLVECLMQVKRKFIWPATSWLALGGIVTAE